MIMHSGFLLYFFILAIVSGQLIPGGPTPTRPATRNEQRLINELRGDIERMAGVRSFPIFRAISYRARVATGMFYYIKIKVGSSFNSYIHAALHEISWLNQKRVTGVQVKKFLHDPIELF